MYCDVVVKAEDFKTIHNALCSLRNVKEQLEVMLNERNVSILSKVVNDIHFALKDAYSQEEADFNKKRIAYEAIGSRHSFVSVWSMFEIEDLTAPHPFDGVSMMVHYDSDYAPIQMSIQDSTRPGTWLDLWRTADKLIKMSGVHNHIYVEGFKVSRDNPSLLLLQTGS